MSDGFRRYTEREFTLILSKAAELDGSSRSIDRIEDGLTIEEIKSIAAGVGLDPDSVVRAARLVPEEVRPSLLRRAIGGGLRDRRAFTLPGELTAERAQRLLAAVRSTMKTHGEGDASASGVSWSTKGGTIFVSAQGDGAETRVEVYVDKRGAVIVPLMLGAGGPVVALYAAIAAGDGGFANPYLVLAGGVGISAALAWSALRGIARRTRATLENLVEAIGDALDRERRR